ncbi:hypothetical protein Tco_0224101 [Tanacetum coccineum]
MSAHDDFSLHDDEELSLHDDASLAGSLPASNKGDPYNEVWKKIRTLLMRKERGKRENFRCSNGCSIRSSQTFFMAMDDAKEIWAAINDKVLGQFLLTLRKNARKAVWKQNSCEAPWCWCVRMEDNKITSFLRSLPPCMGQSRLDYENKEEYWTLVNRMIYTIILSVFEQDIQKDIIFFTGTSINVAFIYKAYSLFKLAQSQPKAQEVLVLVIPIFFQSKTQTATPDQIVDLDWVEMVINWMIAMDAFKIKKFYMGKNRQKAIGVDGKMHMFKECSRQEVGQINWVVADYRCGNSYHALMAFTVNNEMQEILTSHFTADSNRFQFFAFSPSVPSNDIDGELGTVSTCKKIPLFTHLVNSNDSDGVSRSVTIMREEAKEAAFKSTRTGNRAQFEELSRTKLSWDLLLLGEVKEGSVAKGLIEAVGTMIADHKLPTLLGRREEAVNTACYTLTGIWECSWFKALRTVPTTVSTSTNPVNTGSINLNTAFEEVNTDNTEAISPSANHEEEVFSDADDDEMPEIRIYDKSSEGLEALSRKSLEAHALVCYIQGKPKKQSINGSTTLSFCLLFVPFEPRKVSEALRWKLGFIKRGQRLYGLHQAPELGNSKTFISLHVKMDLQSTSRANQTWDYGILGFTLDLEAFSDSDMVVPNLDRKSNQVVGQFWSKTKSSSNCQEKTICTTSTMEAEYVAADCKLRV